MRVPGTYLVGEAMNMSRLDGDQAIPLATIAGEYEYPGIDPDLRPTIPFSEGPSTVRPVFRSWHAAQRANTTLPCAASAALALAETPAMESSAADPSRTLEKVIEKAPL